LHTLFYFFLRPDSQIWIRHKTDRQKCYGRATEFPDQDSAKILEGKKLKLDFAYPSNPGLPWDPTLLCCHAQAGDQKGKESKKGGKAERQKGAPKAKEAQASWVKKARPDVLLCNGRAMEKGTTCKK